MAERREGKIITGLFPISYPAARSGLGVLDEVRTEAMGETNSYLRISKLIVSENPSLLHVFPSERVMQRDPQNALLYTQIALGCMLMYSVLAKEAEFQG